MSFLTHIHYFLCCLVFALLVMFPVEELDSFSCHLSRILQQLRKDHAGVQTSDRRRFATIDDALQRLLPYHVFQGAPPSQDEFSLGTALNLRNYSPVCTSSLRLSLFAELKVLRGFVCSR